MAVGPKPAKPLNVKATVDAGGYVHAGDGAKQQDGMKSLQDETVTGGNPKAGSTRGGNLNIHTPPSGGGGPKAGAPSVSPDRVRRVALLSTGK